MNSSRYLRENQYNCNGKNNPLRVLTVIVIIMAWSGNASKTNDLKQLYYLFYEKEYATLSFTVSHAIFIAMCPTITTALPLFSYFFSEVNCTIIFLFRQEDIHTAWKNSPPSEASLQFICKGSKTAEETDESVKINTILSKVQGQRVDSFESSKNKCFLAFDKSLWIIVHRHCTCQ